MEKLFYLLWKSPAETISQWSARVRGSLAQTVLARGALSFQANLVDDDVSAGAGLRLLNRAVPDGLVSVWVESANLRAGIEFALRDGHARIAGYLVTESTMKDRAPASADSRSRSAGFSLIGMLQRPPRLTEQEWLRIWLGSHTQVAIETQPTFRYVQNVVTRALTEDAPELHAIVEEGFPTAALTDPAAFYDAVDDAEKHAANHRRMMESCHRFIDFDRIDSMPTSEYLVQPLRL